MAGLSQRARILKFLKSSRGFVSARDVSNAVNLKSAKTAGLILGQLYDEGLVDYQARNKGSKSKLNLWKYREPGGIVER